MATLPAHPQSLVQAIYSYYEAVAGDQGGRLHLGASEIGQDCLRSLWYGFRWVAWRRFDGRMLRLFNTGHLAEERLAKDLRSVGVEVHLADAKGKQFSVSDLGGHFSGSMDGCAIGILAAPKTWHLLEFKTHNQKSFTNLVNSGVAIAKPEHFAQMQIYMHYTGMTRALYLAENKDNSELYEERIYYDASVAMRSIAKAKQVIFAPRPLPKVSEDPKFFKCQWCPFLKQCHEKSEMPRLNCRTCLHSTPREDGTWFCEHKQTVLSSREQRAGCDQHLWIPELLPLEQTDATQNSVVYKDQSNKFWENIRGGKIQEYAA